MKYDDLYFELPAAIGCTKISAGIPLKPRIGESVALVLEDANICFHDGTTQDLKGSAVVPLTKEEFRVFFEQCQEVSKQLSQ